MTNLLCVGRVAPNKMIEEVILAFAWYHRVIDRQSRLIIVGSERSSWRYYVMLQMLVSEMDLTNVYFEGYASPEKLSAYYDIADVFVSASRHEGYCLPVVEAMHREVPVVARKTGGIPEAMGGAGVMYEDAKPEELAQLIHRVLTDKAIHEEVLQSQKRRIDEIRARKPDDELRALLAAMPPLR